ncbi:GUN4 domain-containing protein [Anabaena azotica]|uniref:GUN4 domain-containing protein n=1 Tax=Anabaena azotica TaxID=197653 RepID=UPI0039A63BD7
MWIPVDFSYKDLKIALEAKDWQKANEEIICVFDHVWADQLHNYIKCSDLFIIDRLWTDYSDGHFGLSKQLQIWDKVNHNFPAFINRVGWRIDGQEIESFDQLNYSMTAPPGHLPLIFNHHGICQELIPGWWEALVKLIKDCQEIKEGNEGRKVCELQTLLKEKNCYGGSIDGHFNFRTKNAVRLFQGNQNLERTGIADLETWKKLLGERLIRVD